MKKFFSLCAAFLLGATCMAVAIQATQEKAVKKAWLQGWEDRKVKEMFTSIEDHLENHGKE